MKAPSAPVGIRAADEEEVHSCLALDDSYTSNYTWQMEAVRGEPGTVTYGLNNNLTLGDTPLSVTFRPVKLPRARKVPGQFATTMREGSETAQLARLQTLKAADLVLIAEQGSKLCGYLVMMLVPGSGIAWINSLVVANSMRGQGTGSMLLAAARRWARYEHGHNARAMMLELPVKNYPAVAFCRKHGFTFCGYTDYSFSNGDVVLHFVSPVVI